jgi:hypothetical protein
MENQRVDNPEALSTLNDWVLVEQEPRVPESMSSPESLQDDEQTANAQQISHDAVENLPVLESLLNSSKPTEFTDSGQPSSKVEISLDKSTTDSVSNLAALGSMSEPHHEGLDKEPAPLVDATPVIAEEPARPTQTEPVAKQSSDKKAVVQGAGDDAGRKGSAKCEMIGSTVGLEALHQASKQPSTEVPDLLMPQECPAELAMESRHATSLKCWVPLWIMSIVIGNLFGSWLTKHSTSSTCTNTYPHQA